jgi:transcriptional regulator with XRE-family HTH domain
MSSVNENMICETIKMLRTKRGISQDVLAQALDISVQAVSKWETGNSLPDILLLPRIAKFFEITIDELFYGVKQINEINSKSDIPEMKDDGKLRIIQFLGNQYLRNDQWIQDKPITLCTDELDNIVNIEVWGSINIEGDLEANVRAGVNVTCQDIGGDVNAGCDINCADVSGSVKAGCEVNCADICGDAVAGTEINCTDISGNAKAGGNIKCSDIAGNVEFVGGVINRN